MTHHLRHVWFPGRAVLWALVALVAVAVAAPDALAQDTAALCAPKRKRKRKPKPKPPEQVPAEPDEIDELAEKDPVAQPVAGQEAPPESEPWNIGIGAGVGAGFFYSHIIALERAVTSSAPFGGVWGRVDATSDSLRLGVRLFYAQTASPSVSVDGALIGESFDGLGLAMATAYLEVLDLWRALSVGGSVGYLLVLNPLHETPTSGVRLGASGLWSFGAHVGLGAELGFSAVAQRELGALVGAFRGPVVDFTLGVEVRFDEVGTW